MASQEVKSDTESEVVLGPPSRLPLYGPRYAPVTLDVFVPFGHQVMAQNLELFLRLVRESSDVRLIFHPVLGTEAAERGAEAMFAAWHESGTERAFALAQELSWHREWLAGTPEAEAALAEAFSKLGLEKKRLLATLRLRTLRPQLLEIWQSERAEVRMPPEVWINGHRLRGLLSDDRLREELGRQRSRAYLELRNGTPLSRLYEQLVNKERGEQVASLSVFLRLPGGAFSGPSTGTYGGLTSALPLSSTVAQPPPHLDLSGSPSRGPEVAPVTILLIGSLDSYGTCILARNLPEVWAHHKDEVRLVFQHAPTNENGRKVAQLLALLAQKNPPAFWRAFEGSLELMRLKFMLRYTDITDLLRRQGNDVAALESALREPKQAEKIKALLARDLAQAQRPGMPTLPTLLVNGRPLRDREHQTVLQLSRRIEQELKRGLLSRFLRRGNAP